MLKKETEEELEPPHGALRAGTGGPRVTQAGRQAHAEPTTAGAPAWPWGRWRLPSRSPWAMPRAHDKLGTGRQGRKLPTAGRGVQEPPVG